MKLGFRFFMASAGVTALALFATEVSAQVKQELSGHARTRMVFNKNTTAADTPSNESLQNRVRLNIDVMPSSSLKVRMAPQFRNTWGDEDSNVFTAKEAWMSYSPNKDMSLALGRQAIALGNNRHFGTDGWNEDSIVHDAARLNFGFGSGNGSLIYVKNDEAGSPGGENQDRDLYILYTTWNKVGFTNALDLWAAWDDQKHEDIASRSRFGSVGLRFTVASGNADADVEAVYQHGKTGGADKRGYSVDAQVGWSFDGHRVGVLGYYSNDEKTSEFGDKHRLTARGRRILGDAQVFENQSNLTVGALTTNFGISKEFDLSADAYLMMATDDSKDAGGLAVTGKNVGMEFDFVGTYKASDMFSYDAGYALFKPGDMASSDMVHRFYLQAGMTF